MDPDIVSDNVENFLNNYASLGIKRKSDSRKPKITLRHLNKLKRMQTIKDLDHQNDKVLVTKMYGSPPDDGGGL